MKNNIDNKSGRTIFEEMADMVEATSVAITMIDNTPNVHNCDFTLKAVRDLLDAINESSFRLMLSTSPVSFKPFNQL